jgi:hypothetical protein
MHYTYNNFPSNLDNESKVRKPAKKKTSYSTVQNLLNLRTPVEKQWPTT